MFINAEYLEVIDDQNFYILYDDDFECRIKSSKSSRLGGCSLITAAALEYQSRKLPVAKNIAAIYLWYAKKGYKIKDWLSPMGDCKIIEACEPDMQYRTKYYSCVLRQIKILDFAHNKFKTY